MICKNCSTACHDNFCHHCGQPTGTKRISVQQLLPETFFTVVNVNQGFLFTIKALGIRPGKAIRRYVQGQRIGYYPPHKYLFLIGAVAAFFAARYGFFSTQYRSGILSMHADSLLIQFFRYADTYTTLLNIVTIPVFALFSWLLFSRQGFNYAENLVLNTYCLMYQ